LSILRRTPITHLLLIMLVGAYVILLLQPAETRADLIWRLAVGRAPDLTVLTAAFIHLSPGHLLFNLGGIWLFGMWVEFQLPARWYVLLVGWVLAASGLYLVLRRPVSPAIGASGIFAGVFGASLGMANNRWLAVGLSIGLTWLVFGLLQASPGGHDVHPAGILAGCVAGWLLRGKATPAPPLTDRPG